MTPEQAKEKLDQIGMDWLAFAVAKMGGIDEAARKLKVSGTTIVEWLEHGLAGIRFDKIVELARISEVSLLQLELRLGSFPRAEAQEAYNVLYPDKKAGRLLPFRAARRAAASA